MKLLAGILLIVPLVIVIIVRLVMSISYEQSCGGHIKRAGDANTVETAIQELGVAVSYLERNHMTEGYTSVVYNTPDEDVGFWYKNLKSALGELEKVGPDTSQLERTNVLMKLRETLLDRDSVTEPRGISRFPHTGFHAFLIYSFLVLALGGAVLIFLHLEYE